MTNSLPSKKVAVVNAPEVTDFACSFDYNFFTPDEKVNDSGSNVPKFLSSMQTDDFSANFIADRNFQVKVPRYVNISWKPVVSKEEFAAKAISVKKHLSKIHNEQNFNINDFTNIDLQDTSVDQRLSFFIRRALEELQKGYAPRSTPESPLDVAATLNSLTPTQVSSSFLASILVNLNSLGVKFVNKQNREMLAATLTTQLAKTKVRSVFNNKVLKKILLTTTENPIGIFEDEAEVIISAAEQVQRRAIESESSVVLSDREFDLEIVEYIGIRNIDADVAFNPVVETIGYIIDKQERLQDGTFVQKNPIIIENALSSTTADLEVKYAGTYSYKIKSVVYVEVQAQDFDTGALVAISFLMASQQSEAQVVKCIEEVPPPCVTDFNIAWDFKNTAARISWTFPPNPQRDIKHFQIFRRQDIYSPFELIKQFSFDDSVLKSSPLENPDPALIEILTSPKTYFLDKEFNKNSKFIYAICSIDAHGLSSGYSMQLEVSFDKFKNRIVKKLISVSGAPKAYPNMFLNQDTFVDTIRDSGHTAMDIVFNPEFLEVFDNSGNNLEVLKTSQDSVYKMSFINVDLQTQKTLDIKLLDKRSEQSKNNLELK